MTQELHYTSAPRGIKPGAQGFCTVRMTQGMSNQLVQKLESLSVFRSESGGTPSVMHLRLPIAGGVDVLSRISPAGLDYTKRHNYFAHHVVLASHELSAGGPAWLASRAGFLDDRWNGEVEYLPGGRTAPSGDRHSAVCRGWASIAGDAGWGGALAATFTRTSPQSVQIIYEPGTNVLELLAESIALLPPASRWDVTFCTQYIGLPPDVACHWRCVSSDSPEAAAIRKNPRGPVFDLSRLAGQQPPESALVEQARTGHPPRAAAPSVPMVASPPRSASTFQPEPIVAQPPSRSRKEYSVGREDDAAPAEILPPSAPPPPPVYLQSQGTPGWVWGVGGGATVLVVGVAVSLVLNRGRTEVGLSTGTSVVNSPASGTELRGATPVAPSTDRVNPQNNKPPLQTEGNTKNKQEEKEKKSQPPANQVENEKRNNDRSNKGSDDPLPAKAVERLKAIGLDREFPTKGSQFGEKKIDTKLCGTDFASGSTLRIVAPTEGRFVTEFESKKRPELRIREGKVSALASGDGTRGRFWIENSSLHFEWSSSVDSEVANDQVRPWLLQQVIAVESPGRPSQFVYLGIASRQDAPRLMTLSEHAGLSSQSIDEVCSTLKSRRLLVRCEKLTAPIKGIVDEWILMDTDRNKGELKWKLNTKTPTQKGMTAPSVRLSLISGGTSHPAEAGKKSTGKSDRVEKLGWRLALHFTPDIRQNAPKRSEFHKQKYLDKDNEKKKLNDEKEAIQKQADAKKADRLAQIDKELVEIEKARSKQVDLSDAWHVWENIVMQSLDHGKFHGAIYFEVEGVQVDVVTFGDAAKN